MGWVIGSIRPRNSVSACGRRGPRRAEERVGKALPRGLEGGQHRFGGGRVEAELVRDGDDLVGHPSPTPRPCMWSSICGWIRREPSMILFS